MSVGGRECGICLWINPLPSVTTTPFARPQYALRPARVPTSPPFSVERPSKCSRMPGIADAGDQLDLLFRDPQVGEVAPITIVGWRLTRCRSHRPDNVGGWLHSLPDISASLGGPAGRDRPAAVARPRSRASGVSPQICSRSDQA